MPGLLTRLRVDPRGHERPSPGRVAVHAVAVLVALALAEFAGRPAAAADGGALQQKADMLCNMAKFVQWPDGVMAQNHGQLVVTILGEDELAGTLATVLSARQVNGKPVFVRFARRARDAQGSQIVYLAASETGRTAAILAELSGAPVLTIADQTGFAGAGGMVNYSDDGGRLHFEIATLRAERAGLRISSRLLAISHVVDDGREARP